MSDPLLVARYWCHECSRMVSPIMEAEIKCPSCDGGFVEEMEMRPDDPTEVVLGDAQSLWTPIVLTMMHMGVSRHRTNHHPDADDEATATNTRRRRSNAISMLELLHGLRAMASEEEMDAREEEQDVMVLNPFLSGAAHMDASFGDYFVGPGFDRLLQQLGENDPNRQGTPPAQKEAVEALPTIRVAERSSCPVCLDELEVDGEAKEMPCKHAFHSGCLLPWLEMHSSCPVCRFQLPVEGEEEMRQGQGGGESGRGLWPWPFSALFSSEGEGREASGGSSGDGRASL